jgi:hypothetical protein
MMINPTLTSRCCIQRLISASIQENDADISSAVRHMISLDPRVRFALETVVAKVAYLESWKRVSEVHHTTTS